MVPKKNFSGPKLIKQRGIKIAKIERGIYSPNIKSVLKILGPLGYTIKIEKIEEE